MFHTAEPKSGPGLFWKEPHAALNGIVNGDNKCFVTAVLQVLLRIQPLADMLGKHKPCINVETCVICVAQTQAVKMRSTAGFAFPCPVAALVREGGYGDAFKSRMVGSGMACERVFPKCDSWEFMLAFMDALITGLGECAATLYQRFIADHGNRTVIMETVVGMLWRVRKRCSSGLCMATSDVLSNQQWYVPLAPPLIGSVSLEELWMDHFMEVRNPGHTCGVGTCRCAAIQQTFLEREPPVLILRLDRVRMVRGKDVKMQGHVSFPKRIDFMRSGPYTFCGLVRHVGATAKSGHYDAFCAVGVPNSLGTCYGHFNDSRCERVSWETVASRHTQSSVTVLVYARSKFASADDRSGGTAEVPYKRGFQTSECAPPLIPVGVVLFMHFSVN